MDKNLKTNLQNDDLHRQLFKVKLLTFIKQLGGKKKQTNFQSSAETYSIINTVASIGVMSQNTFIETAIREKAERDFPDWIKEIENNS